MKGRGLVGGGGIQLCVRVALDRSKTREGDGSGLLFYGCIATALEHSVEGEFVHIYEAQIVAY